MTTLKRVMHLQVNDSSNIAEMHYSSEVQQLFVVFRNFSVYRYDNVPIDIAARTMLAESVGAFFIKHIRDAFNYEKIVAPGGYIPSIVNVLCCNDAVEQLVLAFDEDVLNKHLRKIADEENAAYLKQSLRGLSPYVHYHQVDVIDYRFTKDLTK